MGAREQRYGKYRIVVGMTSAHHLALIYLGGRKLGEIAGGNEAAAFKAARRWLDDRDDHELAARIDRVPTALEYREALELSRDEIQPATQAMLRAHANARAPDGNRSGDHSLALGEIAAAGGSGDWSAVLDAYGRLGRQLACHIARIDPYEIDAPPPYGWAWLIATGPGPGPDSPGPIRLTLRPQIVTALYDLGMAWIPAS